MSDGYMSGYMVAMGFWLGCILYVCWRIWRKP
jgi:hypothetical protein